MAVDDNADNYLYLNPGLPEVQDHFRKVVMDIVERYDVDGIHYDRVRYPGQNFSYDPVSQRRFRSGGNPDNLSWEDWQRRQITDCLEKVYAGIMAVKPEIKVTAAVWGIYNKNEIPGYSRFSSGYHDYFQDSLQWDQEGCVDALIPMIYWAMNDASKPDYDELLDYFSRETQNRHLYGGMTCWDKDQQIVEAIDYTRQAQEEGVVLFSWGKLYGRGLLNTLQSQVFPRKASVPTMPWKQNPEAGIILGKVVRSSDGTPVRDALVTVSPGGKHRLSSADGTFALLELPPGEVEVGASKEDAGQATTKASVIPGNVTRVTLKI